jgi:hypothetical protein
MVMPEKEETGGERGDATYDKIRIPVWHLQKKLQNSLNKM